MVMQMLKLYDQIDIEKTETPGIRLTCNLSFLPTDERNIAYKAAKVMMEQFDIKQGSVSALRSIYRWLREWQAEVRIVPLFYTA